VIFFLSSLFGSVFLSYTSSFFRPSLGQFSFATPKAMVPKAILSKAAKSVGTPLYMNKATASGERLAYAHCLIKIPANKPLPRCYSAVE